MKQQYNFGQAVFAIFRKSKRESTQHTSQHTVASHLLLPQRTKTVDTIVIKPNMKILTLNYLMSKTHG